MVLGCDPNTELEGNKGMLALSEGGAEFVGRQTRKHSRSQTQSSRSQMALHTNSWS